MNVVKLASSLSPYSNTSTVALFSLQYEVSAIYLLDAVKEEASSFLFALCKNKQHLAIPILAYNIAFY